MEIISSLEITKFDSKNVKYVHDVQHEKHDILGSLMEAKKEIRGEIIILFADIIFDNSILTEILESKSNISIAVDMNWERTYASRPDSSFDDADKVRFEQGNVSRIFKTMTEEDKKFEIGEFIGLMKLSKNGAKIFVEKFNYLIKFHEGKFHNAPSIKKAYIWPATFFQGIPNYWDNLQTQKNPA